MKVKLFIFFSFLTILIGFVIFFFGFRMLNPKHKAKDNHKEGKNEDNHKKVSFIN